MPITVAQINDLQASHGLSAQEVLLERMMLNANGVAGDGKGIRIKQVGTNFEIWHASNPTAIRTINISTDPTTGEINIRASSPVDHRNVDIIFKPFTQSVDNACSGIISGTNHSLTTIADENAKLRLTQAGNSLNHVTVMNDIHQTASGTRNESNGIVDTTSVDSGSRSYTISVGTDGTDVATMGNIESRNRVANCEAIAAKMNVPEDIRRDVARRAAEQLGNSKSTTVTNVEMEVTAAKAGVEAHNAVMARNHGSTFENMLAAEPAARTAAEEASTRVREDFLFKRAQHQTPDLTREQFNEALRSYAADAEKAKLKPGQMNLEQLDHYVKQTQSPAASQQPNLMEDGVFAPAEPAPKPAPVLKAPDIDGVSFTQENGRMIATINPDSTLYASDLHERMGTFTRQTGMEVTIQERDGTFHVRDGDSVHEVRNLDGTVGSAAEAHNAVNAISEAKEAKGAHPDTPVNKTTVVTTTTTDFNASSGDKLKVNRHVVTNEAAYRSVSSTSPEALARLQRDATGDGLPVIATHIDGDRAYSTIYENGSQRASGPNLEQVLQQHKPPTVAAKTIVATPAEEATKATPATTAPAQAPTVAPAPDAPKSPIVATAVDDGLGGGLTVRLEGGTEADVRAHLAASNLNADNFKITGKTNRTSGKPYFTVRDLNAKSDAVEHVTAREGLANIAAQDLGIDAIPGDFKHLVKLDMSVTQHQQHVSPEVVAKEVAARSDKQAAEQTAMRQRQMEQMRQAQERMSRPPEAPATTATVSTTATTNSVTTPETHGQTHTTNTVSERHKVAPQTFTQSNRGVSLNFDGTHATIGDVQQYLVNNGLPPTQYNVVHDPKTNNISVSAKSGITDANGMNPAHSKLLTHVATTVPPENQHVSSYLKGELAERAANTSRTFAPTTYSTNTAVAATHTTNSVSEPHTLKPQTFTQSTSGTRLNFDGTNASIGDVQQYLLNNRLNPTQYNVVKDPRTDVISVSAKSGITDASGNNPAHDKLLTHVAKTVPPENLQVSSYLQENLAKRAESAGVSTPTAAPAPAPIAAPAAAPAATPASTTPEATATNVATSTAAEVPATPAPTPAPAAAPAQDIAQASAETSTPAAPAKTETPAQTIASTPAAPAEVPAPSAPAQTQAPTTTETNAPATVTTEAPVPPVATAPVATSTPAPTETPAPAVPPTEHTATAPTTPAATVEVPPVAPQPAATHPQGAPNVTPEAHGVASHTESTHALATHTEPTHTQSPHAPNHAHGHDKLSAAIGLLQAVKSLAQGKGFTSVEGALETTSAGLDVMENTGKALKAVKPSAILGTVEGLASKATGAITVAAGVYKTGHGIATGNSNEVIEGSFGAGGAYVVAAWGASAGGEVGMFVGSIIPGAGTVVGGAIGTVGGALIGGIIGSEAGQATGQTFKEIGSNIVNSDWGQSVINSDLAKATVAGTTALANGATELAKGTVAVATELAVAGATELASTVINSQYGQEFIHSEFGQNTIAGVTILADQTTALAKHAVADIKAGATAIGTEISEAASSVAKSVSDTASSVAQSVTDATNEVATTIVNSEAVKVAATAINEFAKTKTGQMTFAAASAVGTATSDAAHAVGNAVSNGWDATTQYAMEQKDYWVGNDSTLKKNLDKQGLDTKTLAAVDANKDGTVSSTEARSYLVAHGSAAEAVKSMTATDLGTNLGSTLSAEKLAAVKAAGAQAVASGTNNGQNVDPNQPPAAQVVANVKPKEQSAGMGA